MDDVKKGILVGALLGDALALGAHWIYDTDEITKLFGDFDGYTDPAKNPYHKTKKLGDFTHYGDQMMILVDSIKKEGKYAPEKYLRDWAETMKSYTGYMDHATKVTLEQGTGSDSFDASAVGRIAPLLALDESVGNETISEFIGFTHNHPAVKAGAIYIAEVVKSIEGDKSIDAAVTETSSDSSDILRFRDQALENRDGDTKEVIKKFSQSCGIDGVMQGALHCILKYGSDFKQALLENVKAGGDSAARGMIIGMVLGAQLGYDKLPSNWIDIMNAKV